MPQPLLIALGALALLVVGMLAFSGLKHAFGKLIAATIGFVLIFAVVFFGTSFFTGSAPPLAELPTSLRSPDYWKANLGAAGLGLVLAGLSARVLLTRKV